MARFEKLNPNDDGPTEIGPMKKEWKDQPRRGDNKELSGCGAIILSFVGIFFLLIFLASLGGKF